jgi:hypothetical protein
VLEGIFDERLHDHGRDSNGARVQVAVDLRVELRAEAHLLDMEVLFEVGEFTFEGNRSCRIGEEVAEAIGE